MRKEGITSHQPRCVRACVRACVRVCVGSGFVSDKWCKGLHVKLRSLDEFLEGINSKRKQFSLSCFSFFCFFGWEMAHIYECWKENHLFFKKENCNKSIAHTVNIIQLQSVLWILARFEFCLVMRPVSRAASQLNNTSLNFFLDKKTKQKHNHVSL